MSAPEPIVRTVRRFQCPHCRRGWSKRARAVQHIATCPQHPDYRGCRTCSKFCDVESISVEPLGVVSVTPEECRAGRTDEIDEHWRDGRCPSWQKQQ